MTRRSTDPQPWYRYPIVWMVVGGPLVVVVASLVTAFIAIRGADPVLTREDSAAAAVGRDGMDTLSPAVQARNHAATPKEGGVQDAEAHKPAGD
ncbi:MAG: nitrogen fixation protein FixH [Proteobacteria bacterium]|nr:nitrogen fixation protein FixH [Pseudomonadota bacterium]